MLEKLHEYFDENLKVYSSIDKLRSQVNRKQLRWGPCHTEKFWAENAFMFDIGENLHLIDIIVKDCLSSPDDNVKAVACFDLGEFSRCYPNGKQFLDNLEVRKRMSELLADVKVSAEVKKEAITCYQKLLTNARNKK